MVKRWVMGCHVMLIWKNPIAPVSPFHPRVVSAGGLAPSLAPLVGPSPPAVLTPNAFVTPKATPAMGQVCFVLVLCMIFFLKHMAAFICMQHPVAVAMQQETLKPQPTTSTSMSE